MGATKFVQSINQKRRLLVPFSLTVGCKLLAIILAFLLLITGRIVGYGIIVIKAIQIAVTVATLTLIVTSIIKLRTIVCNIASTSSITGNGTIIIVRFLLGCRTTH